MTFKPLEYTRENLAEEWYGIELHATDGSAFDAACSCIQEKHLLGSMLFTREGTVLASDKEEKAFYEKLGPFSRALRKTIIDGEFKWPKESEDWKPGRDLPNPKKHFVHLNPHGRLYLPHGLTECEKQHPAVVHKLAECIRAVEEKEDCRPPYLDCAVNPVAVCRASVGCP